MGQTTKSGIRIPGIFKKAQLKLLKTSLIVLMYSKRQNKIGYVIINPKSGTIAQFDLTNSSKASDWLKLFSGIKSIIPTVKINNIDHRQNG